MNIKEKGFNEKDLTGFNRKSELVAIRVMVARNLKAEGVSIKDISIRLKRDRATIYYYLYKYKETEFYKNL